MKKIFLSVLSVALIFGLGCGGSQVKQEPAPVVSSISAQNEQLAKASLDGFGYKSSKLDTAKWDRWAAQSAPVVQEILTKLPDGYLLQVTGHADASGPEEPTGDKPGNIKISTDRALTVYNALERANISSPKLTYKGVGSDELLPEYDPRAAEQRRVTFKIVPRE